MFTYYSVEVGHYTKQEEEEEEELFFVGGSKGYTVSVVHDGGNDEARTHSLTHE